MSWRDDALVHAKDQDPKEAVGLLLTLEEKKNIIPVKIWLYLAIKNLF